MSLLFFAKDLQSFLQQLNKNPGTTVVGGCTLIEPLPEKMISTYNNPDLSFIERHERHIDIGAGANLAAILELGQNHLPPVLYEALLSVANPIVRNTATIGGNLCAIDHKHTLYAPLLALDSRLVFQSQNGEENIAIQNFERIPEKSFLSKIRIPFYAPEVSIFRRIGPEHSINPQSASFAFLADTDNNTLTQVRIAFAGPFIFRDKNLENTLTGYKLPLRLKDIDYIMERIIEAFEIAATDQMISDGVTQQFFNLCRYSLEQLM
ncbi:MAG: FAD binding domain-containing protein [Treponema sp.]|nr:FAD binding domain-containing protein [Treponema sp.]